MSAAAQGEFALSLNAAVAEHHTVDLRCLSKIYYTLAAPVGLSVTRLQLAE